ncbi:MAG: T9SS type A sorting domain-containing protein, partial [Saccharofermentanaceae bacterium]
TWSGTPSRWGDYSTMNVDPSDPTKFWYTQEYYQTTTASNWKTRIGCFTLDAATTFSLSGIITYPGSTPTPLSGISLTLKNNEGSVVGATTTDASGSYSFSSLINGNYTLEPSTTKAWGGVTALDVLLFKKHIANIALLEGIFLASGDVNGSGSLTASDVLLVKKRIGSVINSFTVGDWLFNNTAVTISGANVTQNFNGLCYGDANASYNPSDKDSGSGDRLKATAGALTIGVVDPLDGNVTIPVYATDLQNMGSFQFTISYDPEKLTFTGADQWFHGIDNVTVGYPQPGKLTFVWAADFNGITIDNDKLLDLHFTASSQDAVSLTWGDVPTLREFADYNGNLFTPAFMNGGVGNVLGIENLSNDPLMVYPNPAKDYMVLKTLETMQGVRIFNSSGKQVFDQAPYSKDFRISTSAFSAGLYMVRIKTKTGNINRSVLIEK